MDHVRIVCHSFFIRVTLVDSVWNKHLLSTASGLYIAYIITLVGASFITNCNWNRNYCIPNDLDANQLEFEISNHWQCVKQIMYYLTNLIKKEYLLIKTYQRFR